MGESRGHSGQAEGTARLGRHETAIPGLRGQ